MIRTVLVAATLALSAGAAKAEDWSGQVTLYGWGAGVGGDFTPSTGAPTLSFDKSLSDVLEDLDAAVFATGLVRRGDLVLFGDLTYSASSRAGLIPPGLPAAGEITLKSLTLAAGRRFDAGGGTTVDLLGGLRGWDIDGAITTPGPSIAPSASFIDPILAVRVNTPLSDRWSVLSYADIGGFGVGSEFTWQAAVTANWKAREDLWLSIGWRHLAVDYRDGGTVFDGAMNGPLLGLTLQF